MVEPDKRWAVGVPKGPSVVNSAINVQDPLPRAVAAHALTGCVLRSVLLLAGRRTHLTKDHVGIRLHFADGTGGRVFRETVIERERPNDPCLLVVRFRLRLLRGRWHALFRWECLLNTPLFVGFPGLVSKLWVDRDEEDWYRGVYEWDGAANAQFYARSLWRLLELVCPRDAIQYMVVPRVRRDEVLRNPQPLDTADDVPGGAWWHLVAAD